MGKFIESITTNGYGLQGIVTNNSPYYHAENSKSLDGFLRTNRGQIEYYDSHAREWYPLPGCDIDLEINSIHQEVLDWAMNKMLKEKQEAALAEKYPAFKAAKKNYELVKAMIENE